MTLRGVLLCGMIMLLLPACHGRTPSVLPTSTAESSGERSVMAGLSVTPSPATARPTKTETPRLPPERWQEWPIVPEGLSEAMLAVFRRGEVQGNNPRAFSKVGDGGASTVWFLAHYDQGKAYYDLGEYPELANTIEHFQGSFIRTSMAAGRGFNTSILLDPRRANQEQCQADESPLDCEVRLHQPCFAILSLGTNQVWYAETYEREMRIIIEKLLENGVVPILSTKANNLEGDHRINLIIAGLANEYELPLWNFWRAAQPLPNHGLQEDLEHLTYADPDFDNPNAMEAAWPWVNLTALQTLEAMRQAILESP